MPTPSSKDPGCWGHSSSDTFLAWVGAPSFCLSLSHTHTHTPCTQMSRGLLKVPATISFLVIWLGPAFGLRRQPSTTYACQARYLLSVSICVWFCFSFHGDFSCLAIMPLTRILARVSPSHPFFFLSVPPLSSLHPMLHVIAPGRKGPTRREGESTLSPPHQCLHPLESWGCFWKPPIPALLLVHRPQWRLPAQPALPLQPLTAGSPNSLHPIRQ